MCSRFATSPPRHSRRSAGTGLIAFAEGYIHNRWLVDDPSTSLDAHVRARLREAGHAPAHAYVEAQRKRGPATACFLRALGDCAALLLPTTPVLALRLDEVCRRQIGVGGQYSLVQLVLPGGDGCAHGSFPPLTR